MVANIGIDRAMSAIGKAGIGNLTGFFANGFSSERISTGSHIDVKGASFLAGFAYAPKNVNGLALGVFAEFGKGNTDGFSGSLQSESTNKYVGGGVMARYDDICNTGLYMEATARMGRSNLDFNADGFLATASGATRSVDYDMRGKYYSAHVGFGHVIPVTDRVSVDVSTKYFWSRQKGDNVVAAGERLQINDVNSHRVRTGARVRYAYNKAMTVYGGAWMEREFDGEASVNSIASGKNFKGGSLTGNTGIGEIGVKFGDPSSRESRWSVDVGVTGYVGKRRGVGANTAFSLSF